MLRQQGFIRTLALALVGFTACASPVVYVVTGNQQFGTIDIGTGIFRQIGPATPDENVGLIPGPNGSLLTLTVSGNLDAINPSTGIATVIGATGLGACSTPADPCGPKSANALGLLNGTIYATDFQNNLYTVSPLTGKATLVGPTGVPPVTFVPLSTPNPDGSLNFFGEGLFSASGKLYATFDTGTVNFMTGVVTPTSTENIYQIDPLTGKTTLVTPATFALDTVVNVNGTLYAVENDNGQVDLLSLATGKTTVLSTLDPSVGFIDGASPVPEPASVAMIGVGMAALGLTRMRRRR
jgi:outer membrane protein assembly factor BamB